jgi:hypothetical protein
MVLTAAFGLISDVAYLPIPSRQRVFTTSISSVTIDDNSGSVTVERAHGSNTTVETSGSRGIARPTDEEHVTRGVLVIRSSCHPNIFNYCNRNYDLYLPAEVSLSVDTGAGNIAVTGINGALALSTGQGNVTVTDARGTIRAVSGQGNVTGVALRVQSASFDSGQGNVSLSFITPIKRVKASSGQGNVSIQLPHGPDSYHVYVVSGQGSARNNVSESSKSQREIRASSSQGDVIVRYPDR